MKVRLLNASFDNCDLAEASCGKAVDDPALDLSFDGVWIDGGSAIDGRIDFMHLYFASFRQRNFRDLGNDRVKRLLDGDAASSTCR